MIFRPWADVAELADALDSKFKNRRFQEVAIRFSKVHQYAYGYWSVITFHAPLLGFATPFNKTMKVAQKVAQLSGRISVAIFNSLSVSDCFL